MTRVTNALDRILPNWSWYTGNTILGTMLFIRGLAAIFEYNWDVLILTGIAFAINYEYRSYRQRTDKIRAEALRVQEELYRLYPYMRPDAKVYNQN